MPVDHGARALEGNAEDGQSVSGQGWIYVLSGLTRLLETLFDKPFATTLCIQFDEAMCDRRFIASHDRADLGAGP